MKIIIQIDNEYPELVKDAVQRRIALKLSRFVNRITNVNVSVCDINGPRGGIDCRCRVRVQLKGASEVIIEETAGSVGEALQSAVDRTARTVSRRLRHAQDLHRSLRH